MSSHHSTCSYLHHLQDVENAWAAGILSVHLEKARRCRAVRTFFFSDHCVTGTTGPNSCPVLAAPSAGAPAPSWLALMKMECAASDLTQTFWSQRLSMISFSFNSLTHVALFPTQTLRSRSLTTVTMASTLQCYWRELASCFPITASSPTWTTCTTSLKV